MIERSSLPLLPSISFLTYKSFAFEVSSHVQSQILEESEKRSLDKFVL